MGKFDKFNAAVDEDLRKGITKAKEENGTGDYPQIPKGDYTGQFVKLEVGECGNNAKVPGAPLLKIDFKITEGKFKNHHVFMNKVLYTDRTDENWNLKKLMGGVLGWLEKLEVSEDIDIVFDDYDQFEDLILDIAEDIASLTYDIQYDPDAFNSIHIDEVYE